jgi:tetratricopeptide (TPR) repeat protein
MLEEVLHQDYQHDGALWELTEVYDSLGRMAQRKAPQEALAWYQRAMATRARLLALRSEPGALVRAYESRQGALGHHPGDRAPLARWLEGAEDALEHMLGADARNPEIQRDLAVTQALLGDLEREAHRREEARRLYERALARLQRQASLWRQEPRLLRDLVNLYQRMEELEPSRGEAAARWRAQREEALRQLEALERGA